MATHTSVRDVRVYADKPESQVSVVSSRENRSHRDIEREIAQIRGQMDRTIHAIEKRFAPTNLVDQAFRMIATAFDGKAGSATRNAFGRAPLAIAMIGAGMAWLAFEAQRPKHKIRRNGSYGRALQSPDTPAILNELVELTASGANALAKAADKTTNEALARLLRDMHDQYVRMAMNLRAALQAEIRVGHGQFERLPHAPHPAWDRLRRAADARTLTNLADAADQCQVKALSIFRQALRQPLPQATRDLIRDDFEEVERLGNRLASFSNFLAT